MSKEKNYKRLGANWFRKGGVALTALAAIVLCVFVFYTMLNSDSDNFIAQVPDGAIYAGIGLLALCSCLVFCYQLFSIFTNKMVFTEDGIEIKRLFKHIQVSRSDIIRIDGVHEHVTGAPTQNRSVFKIITNTKTYEVNSHEFFGLKKAVLQWAEKNMTMEKNTITEGTTTDET